MPLVRIPSSIKAAQQWLRQRIDMSTLDVSKVTGAKLNSSPRKRRRKRKKRKKRRSGQDG